MKKKVALYLRKSRGEGNHDLENHRSRLIKKCEEEGFEYVEYSEIGSSVSIADREQFSQLLEDIKEGKFYAVVAMALDRLTRGKASDEEYIKFTFARNKTLLITPERKYDFNNLNDEFISEFEGFLGRMEYKTITKRLRLGKEIGAERGFWTNGTPPYPYEYNKSCRSLTINPEKLKVYRRIIEGYLNGKSMNALAIELNQERVPSPKGTKWYSNTIKRLITDQTHLGLIVVNKTEGDGHAKPKSNSKEYNMNHPNDWKIYEGLHEAVKSAEEHMAIERLISENRTVSSRAKQKVYALSGLIQCEKCGKFHTFYNKKLAKEQTSIYMKPCWYIDIDGNQCNNAGLRTDFIMYACRMKLLELYKALNESMQNNTETIEDSLVSLKKNLQDMREKLIRERNKLNNINEMLIHGTFESVEEGMAKAIKAKDDIKHIKKEIEILEYDITSVRNRSVDDMFNDILFVYDKFYELSPSELNKWLKRFFVWIKWDKDKGLSAEAGNLRFKFSTYKDYYEFPVHIVKVSEYKNVDYKRIDPIRDELERLVIGNEERGL